MTDNDVVKRLLRQLISPAKPELGARLKQRLMSAYEKNGYGQFSEHEAGFKRFRDYLAHSHSDVVSVIPGPSDILVELKVSGAGETLASPSHQTPAIRREVWLSFSNPDASRKRFFHRHLFAVRHFGQSDSGPERAEVEAAPADFIEITPIRGDTQGGWMRDFLSTLNIPEAEKEPLTSLGAAEYSSAMNTTFMRALGSRAALWRQFRAEKIVAHIKEWATKNRIPEEAIFAAPSLNVASEQRTAYKRPNEPRVNSERGQYKDARAHAQHLLSILSEEDIANVVMPVLVTTLLIPIANEFFVGAPKRHLLGQPKVGQRLHFVFQKIPGVFNVTHAHIPVRCLRTRGLKAVLVMKHPSGGCAPSLLALDEKGPGAGRHPHPEPAGGEVAHGPIFDVCRGGFGHQFLAVELDRRDGPAMKIQAINQRRSERDFDRFAFG